MTLDATGQGETLRVVTEWDPAILWPTDLEARKKQAIAYREDRDFATVKTIEGKRLRVFHTRRLRRSEMRDVRCLSAQPHQQEVAFAHGVTQVDEVDGTMLRPGSGGRWSPEELDKHFDDATVAEIGEVVLQNSRLPLGLKGTFAGLPSSAAALAAWLFPSVARNPDAASHSKSAPAEPSET